jgi:hypothetical protein
MRCAPDTPPPPVTWEDREAAWRAHVQWVEAQAKEPGKGFLLVMLERQRLDFEAGRFPWGSDDPDEAVEAQPGTEREPLAKMRQAYEKLRPEISALTIKAQYARVLCELGVKETAYGYGYETFRTKIHYL